MKANHVMGSCIYRTLLGRLIRQRTKDEYFCLDDIVKVGNMDRLQRGFNAVNFPVYLTNKDTKDFLHSLELNIGKSPYIKGAKGKSGWVHPFFAIKILSWFNPAFEVEDYDWLFNFLIESRIKGANSYQRMCGVLYEYSKNKAFFPQDIKKIAKIIKDLLGVKDWDKADKSQLENREYLHNCIIDLTQTLQDVEKGVNLGIAMFKRRLN